MRKGDESKKWHTSNDWRQIIGSQSASEKRRNGDANDAGRNTKKAARGFTVRIT
jgi:hypothetical protein